MSSSSKSKTVNGFKWGVIDNFANSGVTFLVGLVLARLLSAEEFGVLGIITIFINLSITIIDGGLATALIRKKNVNELECNTVFYSNLCISIFLMLLLLVSSDFIASFFEQPILSSTLSVMSLVLLINAFSLLPKTILIRNLDFKSQAIFSLVSSLLSGIIGITMAYCGFGVWSLVGQQLSRQTFLMCGYWIAGKWRPRWMFSRTCFIDLFGFGSKLLVANLINSIFKDSFLTVIGKIYSPRDLGFYNRAEQFNTILSSNFGQIVRKVSLPSLSQIQDDEERLRATYRKLMRYIAILSFAAVFTLAAVAEPLIIVLIGEKWLPSVKLLQIMSLYAAIYPLNMLNLNVLNLRRRSDYLLKLEIIKKILFIPVIAVGFFFKLEVMLWAAVIYYYIEFFINGWYSKRLIGYGIFDQVKDLSGVYIISMFVAILVYTMTVLSLSNWLILISQLFVSVLLLVIIYKITKQPEVEEIEEYCKTKILKK
ncbi:MAG: lipopolysaccharide biosynthesis protein [Paraprevotella sp.]|nr:lipopolysaccharide biosynthesis protein [Paraprevotella sp.]